MESPELTVYVGFDTRNFCQEMAYKVCKESLLKHASRPVEVKQLNLKDLTKMGVYYRETETLQSTEFTFSRFLTPHLNGFKGYALFCDSDFLWNDDVWKVMDQVRKDQHPEERAVYCVQHNYQPTKDFKMDGQIQTRYPRKNWSSCMLFNCSHPSVANLTVKNVNEQSGAWLHRMQWAKDNEIGELPHEYNYLVGYYDDYSEEKPPMAIHYTDGGPWHPGYENVEFGGLWLDYLNDEEKAKVFAEREELRGLKVERMKQDVTGKDDA